MNPWNAGWRFPLYLRIWLAVIVAVGLLTVAFGWLWRLNTEQQPAREVVIRNEKDDVLGQAMVRPNRVPGQGLEFDVPLKDGSTITVQLPPRPRPRSDAFRPWLPRGSQGFAVITAAPAGDRGPDVHRLGAGAGHCPVPRGDRRQLPRA